MHKHVFNPSRDSPDRELYWLLFIAPTHNAYIIYKFCLHGKNVAIQPIFSLDFKIRIPVNRATLEESPEDFGLVDFSGIDAEEVLVQHDQVGALACFQ